MGGIVQPLADHKELSPSELAQAVGRSVQRVSTMLGALRLADLCAMIRTESATATASKPRRGSQRDCRAVAICEGCSRPRSVTSDVYEFPEFRKHGSHPYELRWDLLQDADTIVDVS